MSESMEWKILLTEKYASWFLCLTTEEQIEIQTAVDVLEILGPYLRRPLSDSVKGASKVSNLKELRIQHRGKPYRVFYAFDPNRMAVLLCGGRKDGSGDKHFYQRMIRLAEEEFENHLSNIIRSNERSKND